MNCVNNLAIVIPAYKDTFLKEALTSIAAQTNQNFTLYIGDDASPHCLIEIITPFQNILTIVYKKFDENLGSKDLIGQWNRCIDMTQNEDWIWLFSDDDIMDQNCVKKFYEFIDVNPKCRFLHFDVDVIDAFGKITGRGLPFPAELSARQFFKLRLEYNLLSFAVEYIFKR